MYKQDNNQELLGYLASKQQLFRIRIGKHGVFYPQYYWDENKLDINSIVGTITIFLNKPTLTLSLIHTLYMPPKDKKGFKVSTTLILHKGDHRQIKDLPVQGFTLAPKDIWCIFEKE